VIQAVTRSDFLTEMSRNFEVPFSSGRNIAPRGGLSLSPLYILKSCGINAWFYLLGNDEDAKK